MKLTQIRGRGALENPTSRFERLEVELGGDDWDEGEEPAPRTRFYRDTSKTVVTRNDSPDVGFEYSLNPYRGCEHGCAYCYARPSHEYLGWSAGLDFETRVLVKHDAPALLREKLMSPRWKPAPIAISGVTDPYQPVERRLRVTRGCLQVLAEFRHPVSMITKNHLVTRDADLLADLAKYGAARVFLSITTLDPNLQRVLEPRASTPARRLDALRRLSEAGVPVGVMMAPVIPGLTDEEMPALLEAAAEAGALHAGYIPLRLPGAVRGIFESWLDAHIPERKPRVMNRIREIRGGQTNDPRFGSRMRGEGPYAEHMRSLFEVSRRRFGLDNDRVQLSTDAFRRPAPGGQLGMFD